MRKIKHRLTTAFILLLISLLAPAFPFKEAQAVEAPHRAYDTPQAAAEALAAAVSANNTAELRAILGPAAKDIIESGDAVDDAADRAAFATAYAEKNALVPEVPLLPQGTPPPPLMDAEKQTRYTLEIGQKRWLFPVPIVRDASSGRWFFDGAAGVEALLNWRIGQNELAAMQVCLAFADAQQEYWGLNPDGAKNPHYAAFIASTPGKRDGLFWESDSAASPLGKLAAIAEVKGYAKPEQGKGQPYFGYRYRVLNGQGKNAPGGALDYMENGRMTHGFALLAYPEQYGVSGVMSFMVSQDGVVYEKNFGQNTATQVQQVKLFDPDGTWQRVDAGTD